METREREWVIEDEDGEKMMIVVVFFKFNILQLLLFRVLLCSYECFMCVCVCIGG